MEDEEDEKKKDEKIQVVEKGGVHAKEEGTRQKSCGPDRPRERRFLRKNTEILRNPRGMSTKKHKKFEKKILGGGLRKNTEILKNHRGGLRKSQHLAEFQANILGKKSWATF